MKQFLTFLLLIYFSHISAQPYIPMLQEGNAWSVDVHYCPWPPPDPPSWIVTQQISIGEIVTINGVDYKQIYRDDSTSCLLREENGVVYKYNSTDNIEKILFDFNVEIGDSFFMPDLAYHFGYCAGTDYNVAIWYLEVFEIENIFIAGANRKVIRLLDQIFPQGGEVLTWVEGIGTPAGLGVPWPFQDITCGSGLACFTTNGITYYFGDATSCDNTTLQLSENLKHQIVLYPNPITTTSILKFPVEAAVDRLKIFNLSGGLVRDEEITKNHVTISSMDYASGLYFYQVFSENKLLKTEKFIVK